MPNALPYDRGAQTPARYFLRLLTALAQQQGGELHVKAAALEAIDKGWVLVKTWDAAQQEVVLWVFPPEHTEVYVVEPEASAWVAESRPPLEEAKTPARAAVLTDEVQAAAEKRQATRRAVREATRGAGAPTAEARSVAVPFYGVPRTKEE